MLNKKAIFCDGTSNYRIPCEPMEHEDVTIRLRTGLDNADCVYLITNNDSIKMQESERDELFSYYETKVSLSDDKLVYFFEIQYGEETYFYNREGVVESIKPNYNFMITPGFKTPDWAKGAVFYQIYVDRFFNGDKSNDVVDMEYFYIGDGTRQVTEWNKYPDAVGFREFYGGDLEGVLQKLDYLEELGVEVIYLNPIFVSPSNHKYDTQDYDYVDPHFGVIVEDGGEVLNDASRSNLEATKYIQRVTNKNNLEASNELFIKLVDEIHNRGMKVILDGVFNHCGSFNKWLDREGIYNESGNYEVGAYADKNSPYHTFFNFNEEGWPNNGSYSGWWGHDTLPKLNYEGSEKLYNYIMDIAAKWVSEPFNCDGWRLDVAADLGLSDEFNHRFWKDFRNAVKEANPDALILAEHYGDPSSWLQGDEWDSVMNYDAFMEPLTWFLTGVEKHSDEYREDLLGNPEAFFESMKYHMSRYQTSSLLVSMNELSNHDHSRFLTRTNSRVGRTNTLGPDAASENIDKGIMRAAVMVQMTWTGAPTIYYGDEAGVCGWTDPDNRRTYPWGYEDVELIQFHKDIISIHKSFEALQTGSILFLSGEPGLISYGRFDEIDKFVVAVNRNNYEITVDIPVWEIGITDDDQFISLINSNENGYDLNKNYYSVESGILTITLPSISAIILKNINK
jgi:alpha-glucosidase